MVEENKVTYEKLLSQDEGSVRSTFISKIRESEQKEFGKSRYSHVMADFTLLSHCLPLMKHEVVQAKTKPIYYGVERLEVQDDFLLLLRWGRTALANFGDSHKCYGVHGSGGILEFYLFSMRADSLVEMRLVATVNVVTSISSLVGYAILIRALHSLKNSLQNWHTTCSVHKELSFTYLVAVSSPISYKRIRVGPLVLKTPTKSKTVTLGVSAEKERVKGNVTSRYL
ncbi:hypothetical protein HK100_007318 [Physocladia obscura]|uniref:Uncharacterized protein n=1 Tax=Physocladia obscura TaxID=109957 RepID=A0AAD5T784_9FUNG|nr:hypothetical protein HK100_007318 [Physocladia obscura]